MLSTLHITIFINRTQADVYTFASNPENLPLWAEGLARSEVTKQSDSWVTKAPFGKVKIRFSSANGFGHLDHDVQLESDVVVPNCEDIDFTFTLFQQPCMSQQQLEKDTQVVANDLHTVKTLLESES